MTASRSSPTDTGGAAALQALADALGCSTEAFHDAAGPPGRVTETAELLRLWAVIARPEDRRDALAYVRLLSERR